MIQKFEDKLNEDVWAQSYYYSEQQQDLFPVSNESFNLFPSNESFSSRLYNVDQNSFLIGNNYNSKFSSTSLFNPNGHSKKSTQQSISKQCFPNSRKNHCKPSYSNVISNYDVISIRSAPSLRKCASASFNTGLMFNIKGSGEDQNPGSHLTISDNEKHTNDKRGSSMAFEGANDNYRLSLSSSNASFFNDNPEVCNRSKRSLSNLVQHSATGNQPLQGTNVSSRPHSLYVPFLGKVETPAQPPGKQARDILMALSYPPIQNNTESLKTNRNGAHLKRMFQKRLAMSSSLDEVHGMDNPAKAFCPKSECSSQDCSYVATDSDTIEHIKMERLKSSRPHFTTNRQIASSKSSVTNRENTSHLDQKNSNQMEIGINVVANGFDGIIAETSKTTKSKNNKNQKTFDIMFPNESFQSPPLQSLSPLANASKSTLKNELGHEINFDKFEQEKVSQNLEPFTPPLFSPTHPLNHSENTVIRLSHPPVLYPPLNTLQSNCMENDSSSPLNRQTSDRLKSFGSKSISNCSTISQTSQSSSSGDQGSFGASKSLSSFSSFSSSSIASDHIHHCSEANNALSPHMFPNNIRSTSSVSNIPNSLNAANQNKNHCQTDYTKLESIRETSPFSNNLRY